MPRKKGVALDDFATMERLIPGEWKKSHPESHSMVHHTTEEEHVAAILKSTSKRKDTEEDASPNFTELHKIWQTPPNCAKLCWNPIESDMRLVGRFQYNNKLSCSLFF